MASSSCSPLRTFKFEMKVCLGNCVAPLFHRTESLPDPLGLAEEIPEDADWQCLALQQTTNMGWATRAMDLPTEASRNYRKPLPLLKEIRHGINDMKSHIKKQGSRVPRMPQCIVPLKIRDHVIMVKNQRNGLEMAFKPEEEVEGLVWLMEQLQKDFHQVHEAFQPLQDDGSEAVDEEDEEHEPHWCALQEKNLITTLLEKLKGHEKRSSAGWCPPKWP